MNVTNIIVAVIGVIGVVITALLTYMASRDKHRFDRFTTLQAEVSRLRDDIAARDEEAGKNHDEILALRRQVLEQNALIADLRLQMNVLQLQIDEWKSSEDN